MSANGFTFQLLPLDVTQEPHFQEARNRFRYCDWIHQALSFDLVIKHILILWFSFLYDFQGIPYG